MASDTPVSTIMTSDLVTLSPAQSVPEAADVLAERAHRRGSGRRR